MNNDANNEQQTSRGGNSGLFLTIFALTVAVLLAASGLFWVFSSSAPLAAAPVSRPQATTGSATATVDEQPSPAEQAQPTASPQAPSKAGGQGAANSKAARRATAQAGGTPLAQPPRASPPAKAQAKGNSAGQASGQVEVSGVVGTVDASANSLLIYTSYGPVTTTLTADGAVVRLRMPGDAANQPLGQLAVADVQIGSYASFYVERSKVTAISETLGKKGGVPATAAPDSTPASTSTPSAERNAKKLAQRALGIGDGFSTEVGLVYIGPPPSSVDQAEATGHGSKLAIPASFVGLNTDGTLTVTITKYGNIAVAVGPGTSFDQAGLPIQLADLKPGSDLMLYGALTLRDDASDVKNKAALYHALVYRAASIHVVTANEKTISGVIAKVSDAGFTLATRDGLLRVATDSSTAYRSYYASLSLSRLSDLKPGDEATIYAIADNDVEAKVYSAKVVAIKR